MYLIVKSISIVFLQYILFKALYSWSYSTLVEMEMVRPSTGWGILVEYFFIMYIAICVMINTIKVFQSKKWIDLVSSILLVLSTILFFYTSFKSFIYLLLISQASYWIPVIILDFEFNVWSNKD